jgi:LPXTG-site transpeptidase (sortase) family protein
VTSSGPNRPPSGDRSVTGGRRNAVTTVLAVAGLVVAALGAWSWHDQGGGDPVAAVARAVTGAPTAEVLSAKLPQAEPAAPRPGAPRRVVVPALDIDAPVDPVGAPGGTLIPPADPTRLGWWAEGARPGDGGSVLVAGHTVSSGGGALDDLETLARGDRVDVRTATGRTTYAVVQVRTLGRGELARQSQRLFDQDGPHRLVLVTCEDWDGVAYRSNVVVTARPVSSQAR